MEPPADLKTIIDNTARYVAKNGAVFEDRIKTKQLNNPKFKFLFDDDPLHAYYLAKVDEIKSSLLVNLTNQNQPTDNSQSGNVDGDAEQAQNQSVDDHHVSNVNGDDEQSQREDSQTSSQSPNDDEVCGDDQPSKATRSRKLDDYIEEKTMKVEEPPNLNFLAKPAPHITIMESDIIKLTARYIATYGRSFMLDLINKEHSNSVFDFTKPLHGQFSYLTNLIMQYALILNHPLGIVEELDKDISSQKSLIDKFKMRTEWQKMLEAEKKEREENLEREKLIYSQIDWHDFVIVETIDYQPDEKGEFPPTTADQVGTRLLIQQRLEQTRVVPEEMDIEDDEEMDLES